MATLWMSYRHQGLSGALQSFELSKYGVAVDEATNMGFRVPSTPNDLGDYCETSVSAPLSEMLPLLNRLRDLRVWGLSVTADTDEEAERLRPLARFFVIDDADEALHYAPEPRHPPARTLDVAANQPTSAWSGRAGVGARVRELRERRRMTPSGLGKHIGVSRRYILALEGDERVNLSFDQASDLARSLGVTLGELAGEPPGAAAQPATSSPILPACHRTLRKLQKACDVISPEERALLDEDVAAYVEFRQQRIVRRKQQ